MLYSVSFLSFAALVATQGIIPTDIIDGSDCPLAGPAFPAPSRLSDSAPFRDAVQLLEAQLTSPDTGLESNNTAYAIAIFSSKENKTLYERYYTPSIDVGVPQIDQDSVFRLASVSKVFTVWTFLAALGDSRFNDPITRYVPELASDGNRPANGTVYDDIEDVMWEDVTLGDLASQAAGIARDVGLDDLSVNFPVDQLQMLGFPTLDKSDYPLCGGNMTQPPCTRKQFFELLLQKTPIFPSSHSPAYSNIAFNLLGYALEYITGVDLEAAMSEYIFDPLGMTRSSFKTQPATGGVIPVDNITSGWNRDLGIGNAGGGLYMSTTDLVTAGQAMLQSQLLTPAQTRRWFRPRMQTGYIGSAVGAPWEITFLKQPHKRLIPYYIKDGDIDAYHSVLVLSPEQEVGFVVLTAGSADSNAAIIRSFIKIALGEIFAPAIEEQARIEAGLRFNGTYLDAPTNSSVTIAAGHDGSTGLSVTSLVSRGVQIIGPGMNHENPMVSQLGVTNITKLYPTTLKTVLRKSSGCGDYVSRLGFRAAFQPHLVGGTLQDPCLLNWANLDGITYGREGLDDWVFEISEDGIVTGVVSRALQLSFSSKA